MKSRVFVLRHVERDKSHPTDKQTPTQGGAIAAMAMGIELQKKYDPHFVQVVSSPQPRATRTAELILRGLMPLDNEEFEVAIDTEPRLNDFSSDPRQEVKDAIVAAKKIEKQFAVDVEQAMFVDESARAVAQMKATENLAVIDELGASEGDYLVTGHGCALDGVCALLKMRLDNSLEFGMGAIGGMLDKVEGCVAEYEDGILKSVEMIRLPAYLKALFATVS